MWRDNPSTTMVIGWNQVSGSNPVLYYDTSDGGTQSSQYQFSQKPDRQNRFKGMHNHFVRLSGLQPNTRYYFIIVDTDGVSQRMAFQTAPDNPYERLSIIAGGDSRNYREARRNANKLVGKLRPHCVLFGGDMTGGDIERQWRGWFDDWQHTITSDGRLIPIVATRGNHEYSNQTLVELFDVPNSNVYYALTLGGSLLRVYTLNSLIACGGDQKTWLQKDLEQHQDVRWRTAQYHFAIRPHTRRKRERNDQLVNWASLFHKYQVNLVVESDAHCVKATYPVRPSRERGSDEGFIRDDERGTVYLGEGCWGAPLRPNDDNKNWTRYSGSFNQFKWIFVDWDGIEARTIRTDNADEVAAVQPDDIFSPPAGLDIWQPPQDEAVIRILPRDIPVAYSSQYVAQGRPMEVLDFSADVDGNGVSLNWQTRDEPSRSVLFKLQRAANGEDYQTIAHVHGQGIGKNQYSICDSGLEITQAQNLSYRLVHNLRPPSEGFPVIRNLALPTPEWQDYKRLFPDPRTGMLKVFYALNTPGDVRIRLIDTHQTAHSQSEYRNQRSGKFLKSIDMSEMPTGHYLLTIEADRKVIRQFQVHKKI
ncbi:MAG: fibronectin type III domain-containing protein [Bacteroidota bacterium]